MWHKLYIIYYIYHINYIIVELRKILEFCDPSSSQLNTDSCPYLLVKHWSLVWRNKTWLGQGHSDLLTAKLIYSSVSSYLAALCSIWHGRKLSPTWNLCSMTSWTLFPPICFSHFLWKLFLVPFTVLLSGPRCWVSLGFISGHFISYSTYSLHGISSKPNTSSTIYTLITHWEKPNILKPPMGQWHGKR